ncbi:hypothetical protein CRG98_048656, partial [Punica granatum]
MSGVERDKPKRERWVMEELSGEQVTRFQLQGSGSEEMFHESERAAVTAGV